MITNIFDFAFIRYSALLLAKAWNYLSAFDILYL